MSSGALAASGVVFYAASQLTGSLGQWETLIGGVLLIVMAVTQPEGIAGGIRARRAASAGATPQVPTGSVV